MLAARRIMASLEASEQPPKDRNSESSLADLLTEFVTVPNPELLQQNLEGFSAELDVRDQPIDLFPEAHVKRLTLTVKWSEDNRDQISILYFFPAQDSAAGNDGAAVDEGEADQEDG